MSNRSEPIRRSLKHYTDRVMRGAALVEYLPILTIGLLSAMAGYERYGDVLSDHVGDMADQLASNYYQGWFYPEGTPGLASMGGSHSSGRGSPSDPGQGSGPNPQDPNDPSNNLGDGTGTPPFDSNDPLNPGGGPSCAVSGGGFDEFGLSQGGFSPVPSTGSNNSFGGNPIDFGTGNKFQREADYRDFRSTPLEFVRYYNSFQSNTNLGLGYGWRHSYQRRLVAVDAQGRSDLTALPGADSERIKAVRDDGGVYVFRREGDVWQGQMVVDNLKPFEGGWHYETVNKQQEIYMHDGRLKQIKYPSGVIHTLAYEGDQLVHVKDSRGPRIDFHYQNSWVNRVKLPSGQQLNFKYDEHSNLIGYKIRSGGIWSKLQKSFSGHEARYHYESDSLIHGLTGKTDAEGKRYATWGYDQLGRANLSEHAGGVERLQIEYRSDTEVAITNIAGLTSIMYLEPSRPGYRRLVRVDGEATPSCGATRKENRYNEQGFLKLAVDTEGNGLQIQRNERGLITQQDNGLKLQGERWLPTEGAHRVESQWHDRLPLPVQSTQSRYSQNRWMPYLQIDVSYDATGKILKQTATDLLSQNQPKTTTVDPRTWQYTYTVNPKIPGVISELNINGPRKPLSDGSDDIYTQRFNEQGLLTQLRNPLGHTTKFKAHNFNGQPTSVELPNGLNIELTYDDHGNLTTLTRASDEQRAIYKVKYDHNHLLTQLDFPDGSSKKFNYNDARQLIRVENNWGEVREIEPSKVNGNWTAQLVYSRDGKLVRQYERSLDSLGRVLTLLGQSGQQTTYRYTGAGQLQSAQTQGNTQSERYHYDSLGRLSRMVDALGGQTQYSYASTGGVKTVTDANGATTVYTYNGFGDMTKLDSPDTGVLVMDYDSAGNKIRARGEQSEAGGIEYRYDALNRLVMIDRPGDSQDVNYRYDQQGGVHGVGLGRLTHIKDASGTMDYRYDAVGNVLEDHRRFTLNGQTTSYRLRYEYTPAGQLATVIYPNGQRVTYDYDAERLKRLQFHSDSNSEMLIDAIAYQPYGAITQWHYGNDLQQTQSYDADGRLQRNNLQGADRSSVFDVEYQFDQRNNIVGIHDQARSLKQAFEYDALGRVIQDQGDYGSKRYRYDSVGNRLDDTYHPADVSLKDQSRVGETSSTKETASKLIYEANSNRLKRYGDTEVLMSENGNLLIEKNKKWDRRYIYNSSNQVVASYLNQQFAGSYAYNSLGQRTHKMVENPDGNIHTVFHYGLSGQLLGETHTNQQTGEQQHKNYVWLNRKPVAMLDDDAVIYLHTDHLNTPRMATNRHKEVVWRWHSDAFGKGRAQEDPDGDGQLTQINLRFAGQYHDQESGLYYNYHRYYDPNVGRYTQSDPIGLQAGVNTFAYVDSAPLHNTDPLGLFLFAFDGTWNDRDVMAEHRTNVALLESYYEDANGDLSTEYIEGVGTGDWLDQKLGGLSGWGIGDRIDRAFARLEHELGSTEWDRVIDVIGFSRGAFTARAFTDQLFNKMDAGELDSHLTPGAASLTCRPISLRFMGLFDTVGSLYWPGNPDNGKYDVTIDSRVGYVAHAVAGREFRATFDLTSIESDTQQRGSQSNRVTKTFLGAHSDIGGGYEDSDLSDVALQWMHRQMKSQDIKMANLKSWHKTVERPVIHDPRVNAQYFSEDEDRQHFYPEDPNWVEPKNQYKWKRIGGKRRRVLDQSHEEVSVQRGETQSTNPQFVNLDHYIQFYSQPGNSNGSLPANNGASGLPASDNVRYGYVEQFNDPDDQAIGTVDMAAYQSWLQANGYF